MKTVVLKFLRLYQKSHFLNSEIFKLLFLSDKVCRFEPSCSNYTYQAVEKYGVLKGLFLGSKRILKCNPFFKGGYDPVTKLSK